MKSPLELNLLSKIQSGIGDLIRKFKGIFNVPLEEYEKLYSKYGLSEEQYHKMLDFEGSISDNWYDFNTKTFLKELGYDSIISYSGDEFIVFDTRQIKILGHEIL